MASKPQTAAGVRAVLTHLHAEMELFDFESSELRPLIEAILNSPALAG